MPQTLFDLYFLFSAWTGEYRKYGYWDGSRVVIMLQDMAQLAHAGVAWQWHLLNHPCLILSLCLVRDFVDDWKALIAPTRLPLAQFHAKFWEVADTDGEQKDELNNMEIDAEDDDILPSCYILCVDIIFEDKISVRADYIRMFNCAENCYVLLPLCYLACKVSRSPIIGTTFRRTWLFPSLSVLPHAYRTR